MERLTKSEEQMMNIFWDEETPLTSVDIVRREVKSTWGNGFVSNLLRSLLRKGYIKEVGMKHYTTQYAREFAPSLTREEYAVKMILSITGRKLSVYKVMAALTREEENKQEMIKELENLISELMEEK